MYRILQEEGIDLPRYAVLNRDPARPEECNLIEGEDQVEVNGAVFPKPFVEKPVSAEDHNVYIYYPSSAGGGSQRLFRKIGSRSSVYSPESSVRKTGSYIYEEFMPTDGTDVKGELWAYSVMLCTCRCTQWGQTMPMLKPENLQLWMGRLNETVREKRFDIQSC